MSPERKHSTIVDSTGLRSSEPAGTAHDFRFVLVGLEVGLP